MNVTVEIPDDLARSLVAVGVLTRLVVADTSPVRYLNLIGQGSLLKDLFGSIYLPVEVQAELCDANASGH
jgi:hypothetical protein